MTRGRRRAVLGIAGVVAAIALGLVLRGARGDDADGGEGDRADQAGGRRPRGGRIAGFDPRHPGAPIDGRRIAGVVLGDGGDPIAGAVVRLAGLAGRGAALPGPQRTNADGRFDFGPQPIGRYVVGAEAPKLTAAIASIDLRDPVAVPPPDALTLMLHACTASIHGTIRDSAGGVIGGATVALGEHGEAIGGVQADDQGAYELCVPVGSATVMVRADGYAWLDQLVVVTGRTRRDFALVPGVTIAGRVVRAGDRAPVAGAQVELRLTGGGAFAAPRVTVAGADGRFELPGVHPGRYAITAEAERLATRQPVDVIAEVGRPPVDIVCELAATFVVSGKVIERGGGAPVVGARVGLWGQDVGVLDARSADDGSFRIDHVRDGQYSLVVAPTLRGERAQTVTVADADVTGLVIEAARGATISGRVLRHGEPVEGARVFVRGGGEQVTTDVAGRYTLRRVAPGEHRVYAESQRLGAFSQGPTVTVADGEQRTGVDVELELAASVAGVVVDQRGAPVGGAFLRFSLRGGRDFGMASTADDGSFVVRALSGGGDYDVQVSRAEGGGSFPPAHGERFAAIAVRDGETQVTGVRIEIRVDRLAISGRVIDGAGNPVPDAVVRAFSRDRGWVGLATATSDDDGAFTIGDLSAGSYTVQVTAARGDAMIDAVAAGKTGLEVRLAGLGTIEGTIDGFTGRPTMHAFGRGLPHPIEARGGRFQLRNLPAGEYVVTATTLGEGVEQRVTVKPGETATVALHAAPLASVTGTLIDAATRAPVAGARCVVYAPSRVRGSRSAVTDASGAFRIERVIAGSMSVGCRHDTLMAITHVTVSAGQTARVELAASARGR